MSTPFLPVRECGTVASEENSPEYRRAREIHQKARNLRTQALGITPVALTGRNPFTPLSPNEIFKNVAAFAKLIPYTEKGIKKS